MGQKSTWRFLIGSFFYAGFHGNFSSRFHDGCTYGDHCFQLTLLTLLQHTSRLCSDLKKIEGLLLPLSYKTDTCSYS